MKDYLEVTRGIWRARDWGGPYIEIYPRHEPSSVDVLNCWDYETDSRQVGHPYTRHHLDLALHHWVTEQGATFQNQLQGKR